MKIVIPNYFKLFFRFYIQNFNIGAFLVIVLLPPALGLVFGKKDSFYSLLMGALESFLKIIYDFYTLIGVTENIMPYILYLTYGILLYALIIFPFFLIIELFYFKYRIKGYKTQEIKKIFETKSAMRNLKKDMDLDRY